MNIGLSQNRSMVVHQDVVQAWGDALAKLHDVTLHTIDLLDPVAVIRLHLPLLFILHPGAVEAGQRKRWRTLCREHHTSYLYAFPERPQDLALWLADDPDDVFLGDEPDGLIELRIRRLLADRIRSREADILEMAVTESNDPILVSDAQAPDLPITYANSAFERLTGYPLEEMRGRNCRQLQGEMRDQPGLLTLRHALRDGVGCKVTLQNFRKNGQPFWNELTIVAVRDDGGQLTHYIGIQHDITSRVRAERDLAERELRFREIADTAPVMLWVADSRLQWSYFNKAWAEFSGRSLEEDQGRGWLQLVDATLRKELNARLDQAALQGHSIRLEMLLMRGDGVKREVLLAGAPILDDEGRCAGFVGSITDVSDRKNLERLMTRRHRHVSITSMIYRRLLGAPLTRSTMLDLLSLIIDVSLADRAYLLRRGENEKEDVIAFPQDAPPLIPLPRSPERMAEMMESGKSLVIRVDRAEEEESAWLQRRGAHQTIMRALEIRDEVVGLLVLESTDPDQDEWSEADLEIVSTISFALLPFLQNPQETPLDLHRFLEVWPWAATVRAPDGTLVQANPMAKQSSDRNEGMTLELEVEGMQVHLALPAPEETARLVGDLMEPILAGLTHRFNNLLSVVDAVHLTLQDEELSEELQLSSESMAALSWQTKMDLRLLGMLALPRTWRLEATDLNQHLIEVASTLNTLDNAGSEIRLLLSHDLGKVQADQEAVEALVSAVGRQILAHYPGEHFVIGSRFLAEEGQGGLAALYLGLDRGPLPKLMERCRVLTDEEEEGLRSEPIFLLARQLMDQQRGEARFMKEQRGRIEGIALVYPATQPSGKVDVDATLLPDLVGMALIIEDDSVLLWSLTGALEGMGLEVLKAQNPDEAKEKWRNAQEEIGLVICDLILGWSSEDGIRILGEFRVQRPDLPMILISGYPSGFVSQRWHGDLQVAFLSKPCRPNDIMNAIREAIEVVTEGPRSEEETEEAGAAGD